MGLWFTSSRMWLSVCVEMYSGGIRIQFISWAWPLWVQQMTGGKLVQRHSDSVYLVGLNFRVKSGNIPTEYGIPIIRTENSLSRFRPAPVDSEPVTRPEPVFFRKSGNGRVKCRKRVGSERDIFRPFSTLHSAIFSASATAYM
jgi:hypothetical protein